MKQLDQLEKDFEITIHLLRSDVIRLDEIHVQWGMFIAYIEVMKSTLGQMRDAASRQVAFNERGDKEQAAKEKARRVLGR